MLESDAIIGAASGLALVAIIAGAFLYGEHLGVTRQVVKDTAAAEKQIALNQATYDKQLAAAEAASHANDTELSALRAYRDAHPIDSVQLCLAPNSGAVPQAAASAGSSPSAAPAATDVQPLPARDSGVRPGAGPDISGLLDLLASRADEVSAQAAGLQTITASDRQ